MTAPQRPSLSAEPLADGTLLLTLDGDFDLAHQPDLARQMAEPLAAADASLIVDMRGLTFLDSQMLRSLLLAVQETQRRGERVALIRPNPHVWRILQVTGLDKLIPAYECLRDARAALARETAVG